MCKPPAVPAAIPLLEVHMAVATNRGVLVVGVLKTRGHYLVSVFGPLMFGNSEVGSRALQRSRSRDTRPAAHKPSTRHLIPVQFPRPEILNLLNLPVGLPTP